MSQYDNDIARIQELLNQMRPRYQTRQEQLAYEHGVLLAVLAYAVRNDNRVAYRLRDIVERHR